MWNLKPIKDIKLSNHRMWVVPLPKNSFWGASPDGIAKCSCYEEKSLMEVKCPY